MGSVEEPGLPRDGVGGQGSRVTDLLWDGCPASNVNTYLFCLHEL